MSVAPIYFQGSYADLSSPVSVNTTCKSGTHQAEDESHSRTQQPFFFKVATI